MGFPYFKIQLNARELKNGKYRARCSISEHTGDKVHNIQPRWELSEKEFESKSAANRIMKFNAIQWLKREYSLKDEDLRRVRIVES